MIELPVLQEKTDENEQSRRLYWRSKSQFESDPEFQTFVKDEFLPEVAKAPSQASRRQFMQLMGASIAMAGLSGCRKPAERILPFSKMPEDVIPGIPLQYATAMPFRGIVQPIVVESHDGRPTKIEGNANHPSGSGASGVFEQASILNLYDPDRSQSVLNNGDVATWRSFASAWRGLPASASVAVVAKPSSSPTLASLKRQLGTNRPLKWIDYSPAGDDPEQEGYSQAYGQGIRPRYRFSNARVIVSLDSDFLAPTHRDFIHNTGEYSASRAIENPDDAISRLYAFESQYSITGGMADNRLATRSSDIAAVAAAIADGLGVSHGSSLGRAFSGNAFVQAVVDDLRDAGPRGVVVAGETQPAQVHALCAAINNSLGANNTCVDLLVVGNSTGMKSSDLARFASEVQAEGVDALVFLDVDPLYEAPEVADWNRLADSAQLSIHVGMHVDATAKACDWHLPMTHYLEAWGDGRSYDGTLSVIQPLIAPLVAGAISDIELVSFLASGVRNAGYDLVRGQWSAALGGNLEGGWRRVLHDGFLPGSGYSVFTGQAAPANLSGIRSVPQDQTEIVFHVSSTMLDGSYANNAWLLETPDTSTKITWDNVALMSEQTAASLGVQQRLSKGKYHVDKVALTVNGQTVEMPTWVLPGIADNSISVTLGHGRSIDSIRPHTRTNFFDLDDYTDVYGRGAVGNNVGVNVAPLRPSNQGRIAAVSASKVAANYLIATTQDHGALVHDSEQVEKRNLFRMETLAGYRENPTFASDAVPPLAGQEPWEEYPELWEKRHPKETAAYLDNPYAEYQWGMVIDLNACTGCNTCMVACQSENNVQIVGKEEVSLGREMHWIRLDRYFVSGPEDPDAYLKMVVQPVPCMHCEDAPCESVCPVAATVHSPDGTNQMIYNRCIGTRYCANNCPFKVRRFNFYNWTKTLPTSVHFAQNPDVTVRSRGVMEKCSYCIQRVRQANIRSNLEKRPIADGEVKTACEQACPANAITFGNIKDSASAVSQKRRSNRRYEMLAELSVKPRTSYLGRVENPNPRLGKA